MRNFKIIFLTILLGFFFAGCTAFKSSKGADDSAISEIDHVKYPNAYLERIAGESVADLLSRRIVKKKSGRFSIVGIEPLDSTNTGGVDTAFLSKKIRISLLHSGRAVVTDAPSKDELIFSNDGFRRTDHTVGTGSIYEPDYILIGKISPASEQNLPSAKGKKALAQADDALFLELFLIDTQNNKSVWKYKKALQKQI